MALKGSSYSRKERKAAGRKHARVGARVRLVVEYHGGAFDEQGVISKVEVVDRGFASFPRRYHVRIAGIDFVLKRNQFEVL